MIYISISMGGNRPKDQKKCIIFGSMKILGEKEKTYHTVQDPSIDT
jgi:hypothetical protein